MERLKRLRGRAEPRSEVERPAAANGALRAKNAQLETTVGALRTEIGQLQATVTALRAENSELRDSVGGQQSRIAELERQVEQQAAKLATNSRNSSAPPSSDGPAVPPRRRKKRGLRRGGQPGHEGATRALVALAAVDEVVDCRPESCTACGALLLGEDASPERRQIIDVPTPKIIVREYRLHRLICLACGSATKAEAPEGLPDSVFGVGLHALAALLVGRFRQSKRLVTELFEVVYGLSISPGSICAMEQRVAAALAEPVEEARAALRRAKVVGKDETGWRLLKAKAWLWVTATDSLAVFTIARRRSSQIVKQILGEAFAGVVCSDRWSAYTYLLQRQICWAHLLRDFTAMSERHRSAWHRQRLAECARRVMAAYAERQAGRISHDEMVRCLVPVRERTRRLLTWTANSAPGSKAQSMAREILKLEAHLWTFLDDASIPVTNNLCERLLRYAVIWRKLSYGCDSEAGARFVERILSVSASLQLQRRDVFAYLTAAIDAHFRGQPAPSILPASS